MLSLALAVIFFVGIHFAVAGSRMRDRLVARMSLRGYLGAFSLVSAVGLGWLIWAYATAPHVPLWGQLYALRWPAAFLVALAFLLVVLGLTTPSPTAVGADGLLEKGEAARGILRVTRHPFLMGVALWGLTHLVVNGDLASLLLFGGLTLLAVLGPFSIDRRKARLAGALAEPWARFTSVTSVWPFQAIAEGRNRLVLGEIGLWRVAAALALYALLLVFHSRIFGGAPIPG